MSEDNKWSKPASPPPPLFLGEKERNLVKQVNDEIIERVIGQQVLYFPIDMSRTNFHPVYGEAIEKTFLHPIRVTLSPGIGTLLPNFERTWPNVSLLRARAKRLIHCLPIELIFSKGIFSNGSVFILFTPS